MTDVSSVVRRAVEVIGDRDAALRWMDTPIPLLDYAKPMSLLDDLAGRTRVMAVLAQLEHGVL